MIGLDQEGKRVVNSSDPVEELDIFRLFVKLLTIMCFTKQNRKQLYQSNQPSVKWRKDLNCFLLVKKKSILNV